MRARTPVAGFKIAEVSYGYPALSVEAFGGRASEPHVDGRDELRELGQLILLEHGVLPKPDSEEQCLGVEPGPAGPRVQVAPRDRNGGAARADARRPPVRELIAQRQLAQLGVAGVVEHPIDERPRRLDSGDERRVVALRIDVLEAGLEHLAAGAQVVVGLLEAVLVVDQDIQPQPAAERERRADATLGLGRRLAEEYARGDEVPG